MFKIKTGLFLEASTMQTYDISGLPEIEITIQGDNMLQQMQTDISEMQGRLNSLMQEQHEEAALRAKNPALQDLYDKYQIVAGLVKENNHV